MLLDTNEFESKKEEEAKGTKRNRKSSSGALHHKYRTHANQQSVTDAICNRLQFTYFVNTFVRPECSFAGPNGCELLS